MGFHACARAVAVAATLLASTASADEPAQPRRMAFVESGAQLRVSVGFSEILDSRAFARLSSGFPTTVIVRGTVVLEDGEIPVALSVASYRVVYDHWDELYTVQIDGPDGSRVVRVGSRADVLALIGRLDRMPVAPLDRLAVGPNYYLALIVELNPLSKELLAEVRRWLSKPAGQGRLDVSSSMFGSFVSVFVNPELARAERVLRLRSQPFYRVPR